MEKTIQKNESDKESAKTKKSKKKKGEASVQPKPMQKEPKSAGAGSKIGLYMKKQFAPKAVKKQMFGIDEGKPEVRKAKSERPSPSPKAKGKSNLGSKISGKLSRFFGGGQPSKKEDKSKAISPSKIKGRRWWSYKETDDRILSAKVIPDKDKDDDGTERRKIPEPRLVTGEPVERPTGLDPYLARQKKNQTVAIQPESKKVEKSKEVPKTKEPSDDEGIVGEEGEENLEEEGESPEEKELAKIKMPIIIYRIEDEGNIHALRGTEIPPEKLLPGEVEYVVQGGKLESSNMSTVMRGGRVQTIYKREADDFRHTGNISVVSTVKPKAKPDSVVSGATTRRDKRKEVEEIRNVEADWDKLGVFLGDLAKNKAKTKAKEARKKRPPPSEASSSSSISSSEESEISVPTKPTVSRREVPPKPKIARPTPSELTFTPKEIEPEPKKPQRAKTVKPSPSKVSVTPSRTIKPTIAPSPSQIALSPSRTIMPTFSQLEMPQTATLVEPSPSQIALSPSRTIMPTYSQLEMPQTAVLVEPSPSQIALSPSRTIMPTYSQLEIPQTAELVEPSPSQVALSPSRTIMPTYSQLEIPQTAELMEPSPSQVALSPSRTIMPTYSQLEIPQTATVVTLSSPEMESESSISSETTVSSEVSESSEPSLPKPTVSVSRIAQPPTTVRSEKIKPASMAPPCQGICSHNRCMMRPCAPCPPPIAFSYSFSSGMPCNYHRQECASSCLKDATCTSPCLPNIPCSPCMPAPCSSPCYQNAPCCCQNLAQYPYGGQIAEGLPPASNAPAPPSEFNASKAASSVTKKPFFKKTNRSIKTVGPSPKSKKKGFFGFFK